MLKLSRVVNDASRTVTLTVLSDRLYVDVYRRVGLTEEQVIATQVPVDENGIATFTDPAPPQKTLLTYSVVDSDYEKSPYVQAVVPSTWQLPRPSLAGDIRLGELIFNTIDENGTVWTVSDIEGWWTLPESEIPTSQRARDEDGAYDDDGRYLARELNLIGVFLPQNRDLVAPSRAKLVQQLDAVRRTVYLRVDEDPPRQVAIRYNGKATIDTIRQSGLTQFQIQLRAPDPIKYSVDLMTRPNGDETSAIGAGVPSGTRTYPRDYDTDSDNLREYGTPGSPNSIDIVNLGTYNSPPVITITGPVTNPFIELASWPGKQLNDPTKSMGFVTSLATGESLEIDVKEKTVLLNGNVSRRGTMTFDSEWFTLPPGESGIRYTAQSAPGGTTSISVCAYSAWLG